MRFAWGLAALCALSGSVSAQMQGFAVYGGQGLSIGQSTVIRGGATGSNGNVQSGAYVEYNGLYGAGSLISSGSYLYGPVTFNGDVVIDSFATVRGNINAGGNVQVNTWPDMIGNITAAGNVGISGSGAITGNIKTSGSYSHGSFHQHNGNIFAGGNVAFGGTITGDVTYGGTYTPGTFATLNGSATAAPFTASPVPFAPRTLPAATVFTSGGGNIIDTSSAGPDTFLTPGSYGNLIFDTLDELTLSAGDYYFDSFDFDGWALNLTGVSAATPIRIFVSGDITTGALVDMTINGIDAANAPLELSRYVSWETHGDYIEDNLGGNELIGTVFAPNGDIRIGQYTDVRGQLIAGGMVYTRPGATITAVPEPTGLVLVSLIGCVLRRRKR